MLHSRSSVTEFESQTGNSRKFQIFKKFSSYSVDPPGILLSGMPSWSFRSVIIEETWTYRSSLKNAQTNFWHRYLMKTIWRVDLKISQEKLLAKSRDKLGRCKWKWKSSFPKFSLSLYRNLKSISEVGNVKEWKCNVQIWMKKERKEENYWISEFGSSMWGRDNGFRGN